MKRTDAIEQQISGRALGLVLALFIGVTTTSCTSTCGGGFWNGSSTTVAISNSCAVGTTPGTTGVVHVQLTSSTHVVAGSATPNVQHIYVSLMGVQVHTSANAGENSPGWQELAPELTRQPVQVDLMEMAGDSRLAGLLQGRLVPADVYNQARVQLLPDHFTASEMVPLENLCGNIGNNCVITADDVVRPVELGSALSPSGLYIPTERINGGSFRVFPNTSIRVNIEFDTLSPVELPTEGAARIFPVLMIDSIPDSSW